MNAWFERNQRPKMVKIAKIGQLQMSVESRESIMHLGFFHSKHSLTIAEQKKLHTEDRHNDDMVTRYAGAGRVQTIKNFCLKIV
jgi:hypothetical protein